MKFIETELAGGYIVELERREDERGYFARAWCKREFEEHGLNTSLAQANLSHNNRLGTLRGMHFQRAPHQEAKFVRCTSGAIFDVMVDMRAGSPTYKHWHSAELTRANGRALYVPEGFAHGYQTLADNTDVFYQVSEFYAPDAEGGFRWDDPEIGIDWPIAEAIVSDRDRALPAAASITL